MVKTTLKIAKPENFNFQRTLRSHGWCELPPTLVDETNWVLTRVFALDKSKPVAAQISDDGNEIKIVVAEKLSQTHAAKITADTKHILRLDENFAEFYELTAAVPELAWIAEMKVGRLLRSPTVWEDLVKTICTTNCSWALTLKMTANLVEKFGESTADGAAKSFPTPAAMAAQDLDFYKNEIRAGYRSQYFVELSNKVAGGELDVEGWLTTDLPTAELKKQIKSVKGAGDYAAENLLKLLGRYDGLALDSWLRSRFAQIHHNGIAAEDSQIRAHYEHFGKWRGLAIWLDSTRHWF